MSILLHTFDNKAEINCAPLSEVNRSGTPNRLIPQLISLSKQVEVDVSFKGTLHPHGRPVSHSKQMTETVHISFKGTLSARMVVLSVIVNR